MVDASSLKNTDLSLAVELMERRAANNGILGAAFIGIYQVFHDSQKTITQVKGLAMAVQASKLSRKPEPENPRHGPDDKGTDYLAMAQAKAARRLREEIGQDVGDPQVRRGEDPATGDEALWLASNILAVTSFSGAPEMEQDRQIAEYGIYALLSYWINPEEFAGHSQWFADHPNCRNISTTAPLSPV